MKHSATIDLSSGEIRETVTVMILGECHMAGEFLQYTEKRNYLTLYKTKKRSLVFNWLFTVSDTAAFYRIHSQ